MNFRSILLLVAALAAAGFTAFFARGWISAERAAMLASVPEQQDAKPSAMVLVAKEEMKAGAFVKPDQLKWAAWPEEGITEEYIVKGKRDITDFDGAVVRNVIAAGQPITDARVVHPGDRGFLAAVLTPGMRAVSVPVNATSGISGFVFPGDWVDVVLTMRVTVEGEEGTSAQARHFSETLLTNVRVLAIDQKTEKANGEVTVAKTATLEVDPKQVEKVALGLELGNLSLSLLSLARVGEEFAHLTRDGQPKTPGQIPGVVQKKRSYTMDREITYPPSLLGSRKQEINVLRGGKDPEIATF